MIVFGRIPRIVESVAEVIDEVISVVQRVDNILKSDRERVSISY